MGGSAKSRLVFELLNSAYRFGKTDDTGVITIAVSENDLAKRSGLTRETISRTMKQLKQAGCVRVHHHGIEIPDLAKLEDTIGLAL
jgi:CRP-like cAMP-binding protein